MLEGFLGLLVLICDVYAISKVGGSAASTGTKIVWVLVIVLLPVFGLVLWWLAGPK